jgi:hypothetical protein
MIASETIAAPRIPPRKYETDNPEPHKYTCIYPGQNADTTLALRLFLNEATTC